MEINREHFCAIIFNNFRHGLTQQQCIDDLKSIFGDEVPSRTSVYQWYGEYNRGRRSFQDEFRKGHPKSVVIPETTDAVLDPLGVGSHTICQSLKQGWCQLIERNATKIRSRSFETRL